MGKEDRDGLAEVESSCKTFHRVSAEGSGRLLHMTNS